MSLKVLFIGAGPVSALIAHNISKCSQLCKLLDIYIWEKSNVVGGRFATINFRNAAADLGAQYFTHTKSNLLAEPYFKDFLNSGHIQKLDISTIVGFQNDDMKENYSCTQGTRSIVEYLFETANLLHKVSLNKKVSSLAFGNSGIIDVSAAAEINGFDIVISTIPTPQFLDLDISPAIWKDNFHLKSSLSDVKYTSRFALALFFDQQIELQEGEKTLNFIRKDGNPICYWTLRTNERSKISSILIHTNVTFGNENLEEDLEKIQRILVEHAFQEIQSIRGFVPVHAVCHKWKYSQVHTPYQESPGFIEISKSPLIIAAGDGFTDSGLESCILSAKKTTDHLREILTKAKMM